MNQSALIDRHTDVLERYSGSRARNSAQSERATKSAKTSKLARLRAIMPRKPPTDFAQFSASITSSTHIMDGVLIVSPTKMPSFSLPFAVMRKIFGIGLSGTKLSSRSTARGPRIRTPCAASPPSAFCHENVTTSSLSHGRSIAKAAEVASQIVSPVLSAAIQSPFGTQTPDVVPFHAKTTSRFLSARDKSGKSP